MNARLLFRLLLVLLIVGLCWIIYRGQVRGGPRHYWNRAQAATANGDLQSAKLYLQSLLRDFPEHAEGHRALGEALLSEAEAAGRPAAYARHPEALSHLAEAAKLRPQDIPLQKSLLKVYLDGGAMQSAGPVARRVAEHEPDHGDALFTSAWQAVESQNAARALPLLEKLGENPPAEREFQTLVLAVRHHTGQEDQARVQQLLEEAEKQVARGLDDQEALANLSPREHLAVNQLLQTAINVASDVEEAHDAAELALTFSQGVASAGGRTPGELAASASQVMAVLSNSHPLAEKSGSAWARRTELGKQAQQLWSAAIDAEDATPMIYQQAARTAFFRGEHELARETLKKGITAVEAMDLPADRRNELMDMHLLLARNLVVMRQYGSAKPHVRALLQDDNYQGWGHLLSGAIASGEGRHEKALNHYGRAQQQVGHTVLVQLALANTYVKLGKWAEALPLLQRLHGAVDPGDTEQQAWASLHQGFEEQLHWGELLAHLRLGRWDQSQSHVKALQDTRLAPRALAAAVSYQWQNHDQETALAQLAEAREGFPEDLDLLRLQASLWLQAGRPQEADKLVEDLSEARPDHLAAQMFVARWRLARGKPDEALALLDSLEQRFADRPSPQFLKAQVLMEMNKPREALNIVEKLQQTPATARLGNMLQIATNLQQGELAEAAEGLRGITGDLDHIPAEFNLWEGKIAAAQGDFATAVEAVGRSLDVTGLRRPVQLTLLKSILLLAVTEGLERADAELARLLEEYPEDHFLLTVRADLRFKQGKFDEGIRVLERVQQLQPGQPTAPYLKAAAWSQAGDVIRALEEIQKALEADPQHIPSHTLAAHLNLAAGQLETAIHHAQFALSINPQLGGMHLVWADALNQLGRRPEAVILLQQVLERHPKFLAGYRGLMVLHSVGGDPERALRVCRDAQKALPQVFTLVTDEIAILCQLGRVHAAEGLAREAASESSDAVKLLALGQTFWGMRQLELARNWGERALEAATRDAVKASAHLLLGEVDLFEGQSNSDRQLLSSARAHFTTVTEVQPNHFIAGNNLAWLLATEFEEPKKAVEVVEQVLGKASIDRLPLGFIDTLAVVYRRANELEKAQQVLEQAVAARPDQAVIQFHLGMVLADRRLWSAARTRLERALQLEGLTDEQKELATRTYERLALE